MIGSCKCPVGLGITHDHFVQGTIGGVIDMEDVGRVFIDWRAIAHDLIVNPPPPTTDEIARIVAKVRAVA